MQNVIIHIMIPPLRSPDQIHADKQEKITRRMASSGMLRRVALVRTDVSEELSASFIRVTTIGEVGTSLAVTNS
jgi:hypothetical protein